MAPIRIGFIGLSSNQSWAVWAHLPYLKDTSKYSIVALCNSSVESAKAAIQAHGLPSGTKAYGSPEDLAADPDVVGQEPHDAGVPADRQRLPQRAVRR